MTTFFVNEVCYKLSIVERSGGKRSSGSVWVMIKSYLDSSGHPTFLSFCKLLYLNTIMHIVVITGLYVPQCVFFPVCLRNPSTL